MKVTLQVWRQAGPRDAGHIERYECIAIATDLTRGRRIPTHAADQ